MHVRPILPTDRAALADAFERLSPETRYRRFLGPKPELTPKELIWLTDVDHVTHEAMVAVDDADRIIGVARYNAFPDGLRAEIAFVVADAWQGRGIGRVLAERVVERANEEGFAQLEATTFWENRAARALLRRLGFRATGSGDGLIEFALVLPPQVAVTVAASATAATSRSASDASL